MSTNARPEPEAAPRVFVVEDEALIALELLDVLGELGYEACGHAANGEHALHAIAQARPDVVLMDINLGAGIDGIQTARRLQDSSDVPVVFLTAYCDETLIARAAELDAFGYVMKPFTGPAVKAALAMALARHADVRRLRATGAALSADADRLAALRGILPVCMNCHKVCDQHRSWQPLDVFLATHAGTQFSHGYCPTCVRQVYATHGLTPPRNDRS